MKKIGFIFFALALGLPAFGQNESEEKSGTLLNIDFQFKGAKKSFQTKNKLILSKDNNDWTALAPSQDGVALLGKLLKSEAGVFTAQYMIVDTSVDPVKIYQMGVGSLIGKQSRVSTRTDGDMPAMSVALLAEDTTYREENESK